jgi:hypothetical protein
MSAEGRRYPAWSAIGGKYQSGARTGAPMMAREFATVKFCKKSRSQELAAELEAPELDRKEKAAGKGPAASMVPTGRKRAV